MTAVVALTLIADSVVCPFLFRLWSGRVRNYRAAVRGGEDPHRGDGGVHDQEKLPRAVHQRCQRAPVEVPIPGD